MSLYNEKHLIPLVLSITSFLVYLITLCPTVYLGDSGELTAAAFSLGIPHGSGYPLYALVGKLFCMIPLGNVAFRMNLMSTFFAVLTLWLIYSLIVKITFSKVAAFVGALALAFSSVFWFQTVSAEVYTLHIFFVALLIRLLWWWDERREFYALVLFVFITGISFGNHLQTVMLAPAVLLIVLTGDRESILDVRHFFILSIFFIVALSIYLYLPIRTEAGAAIHWGDPNSLDRFLAHVTGRSHRGSYVLNKTPMEYLFRTQETLMLLWSQFGMMVLFSVWGLVKLPSVRWRMFFVLVIVSDFVYTVFLNTISLKVTAFNLPTSIVLAILMGVGIAHVLKAIQGLPSFSDSSRRLIRVAFCILPLIGLFANFGLSNQSRNYTGYEHAVNIFRTTGYGDILFVNGDNYVFPVTYGRTAENMREDIRIYDRLNILFKMPNVGTYSSPPGISWEDQRNRVEQGIVKAKGSRCVFYAVFGPYAVVMPDGYRLVPQGLLYRAAGKEEPIMRCKERNQWRYYSKESFYDNFEKDFMAREVAAYFYFRRGEHLILSGRSKMGLENLRLASQIGHDDILIHSDMAVFLTDIGFFTEAHKELQKALLYHEDLSAVHNNWGYYYHKIGDHEKAVTSFRKAIDLKPQRFGYHNNLGFALYELGKKKEALAALQKSLAIKERQPGIREFRKKFLTKPDPVREE